MKEKDASVLIDKCKGDFATTIQVLTVAKELDIARKEMYALEEEADYFENIKERLPKDNNDFLFAEGKSASEKFDYQRLGLGTASDITRAQDEAKRVESECLVNSNKIDNYLTKNLAYYNPDKLYETYKNKGEELDKKVKQQRKKKKIAGLILLFVGLLGFLYSAYEAFLRFILLLEGLYGNLTEKEETTVILIITGFALASVALFAMMIVGIVTLATRVKDNYSLERYIKELDKVKNNDKIDFTPYDNDVSNLINYKDEFVEIGNKAKEYFSKFDDFETKYVYRYLPGIDIDLRNRVVNIMYEGSATSYTEAVTKAQNERTRERERAEDIARENRRDAEQRSVNQELLASQRRTEQYAKDQAYYSKRQADYASSQTKIMEKDAKANAKYRDNVLRQNDRLIDEYKKNNE